MSRQEAINKQRAANAQTGKASDEWLTPTAWLDLVRGTFGAQIDLDPCSCEAGQRQVQATRWFGKEQDGLAQRWHATNVFLNPPYSQVLIRAFVDKLHEEWVQGMFTEAIILTNSCPDTGWWQTLYSIAGVIAFPRKRIRFLRDEAQSVRPMYPSCFSYLGPHPGRFAFVFGIACSIVRPARWTDWES